MPSCTSSTRGERRAASPGPRPRSAASNARILERERGVWIAALVEVLPHETTKAKAIWRTLHEYPALKVKVERLQSSASPSKRASTTAASPASTIANPGDFRNAPRGSSRDKPKRRISPSFPTSWRTGPSRLSGQSRPPPSGRCEPPPGEWPDSAQASSRRARQGASAPSPRARRRQRPHRLQRFFRQQVLEHQPHQLRFHGGPSAGRRPAIRTESQPSPEPK